MICTTPCGTVDEMDYLPVLILVLLIAIPWAVFTAIHIDDDVQQEEEK